MSTTIVEADRSLVHDETTALLFDQERQAQRQLGQAVPSSVPDGLLTPRAASTAGKAQASLRRALPVALFAALAMASTAATALYAYGTLLCKDPIHCKDSERNAYAGAVALATFLANLCGLLLLGFLEKLSRRNRKAGLALWVIGRSMSVIVLALGVSMRSIPVVLSGRIFEGLASDNLLHFNLNAIYVQAGNSHQISRLVGSSLALYMIGISVSPVVASLFKDFSSSFIMALCIFAFTFVYILIFVTSGVKTPAVVKDGLMDPGKPIREPGHSSKNNPSWQIISTLTSPLQSFYQKPVAILPGLSLLVYNGVQSYVFTAILVHTSIKFNFTSQQNGFLISTAHAVSAFYLFMTLFALPFLVHWYSRFKHQQGTPVGQSTVVEDTFIDNHVPVMPAQHNAMLALFSLSVQCAALVLFSFATNTTQIFCLTGLLAFGLAAPSFIKSYFYQSFPGADASGAVAAMMTMETTGSLLAPAFLGGLQTAFPGDVVFLGGGAGVAVSALLFAVGAIKLRQGRYERLQDQHDEADETE